MDTNKQIIVEKIKKYLRNKNEVMYAYIFGSFLIKENYHDLDIALYLDKEFDKNDFVEYPYGYESKIMTELEQLLKQRIDIVIMNNAGITILQRIINKGKLIVSKNDKHRIDYENYIRKLYIDAGTIRKIKNDNCTKT